MCACFKRVKSLVRVNAQQGAPRIQPGTRRRRPSVTRPQVDALGDGQRLIQRVSPEQCDGGVGQHLRLGCCGGNLAEDRNGAVLES